mgnify:CR=1 FL=1
MTAYYHVEPEATGYVGEQTEHDGTEIPPVPSTTERLHHEINVWMGDDLVAFDSFFITTPLLKSIVESEDLSGYEWDDVLLTSSTRLKSWDSHVGILWFAPDECWLSQAAVTPIRRWVRVVLPR